MNVVVVTEPSASETDVYPDLVNVKQFQKMMGGISVKAVYQCLHDGEVEFFKIGRGFLIPKASVIAFVRRRTNSKDV